MKEEQKIALKISTKSLSFFMEKSTTGKSKNIFNKNNIFLTPAPISWAGISEIAAMMKKRIVRKNNRWLHSPFGAVELFCKRINFIVFLKL